VGVPARALVCTSVLATGITLLNYDSSAAEIFNFLLLISTCCTLFLYLACMLAALVLRLGGTLSSRLWLPWIAGLGVIYSAWTIYGAGGEAVAWGLGLLLLALPAYYLFAALGRRSGVG